MGAMTLLVNRRGAELSLSSNQQVVCLYYPDGEKHRVGLLALRRIVIYGEVNLSAAFLRACEAAKVSIILLPTRRKGNNVNLFPYFDSHLRLRRAQYQAHFDEQVRLSLARQVIDAKIRAQESWLNRHSLSGDFSQALANVPKAVDNASLMGIEGSVAQKYFEKWRSLWDKTWGFKERNRRPPRDPVNALLSLSYTLAGNNVGQLVSTYGLDVSLGFLHVPGRNRPSLMLDLLEPVRPWVDEWLWQQVQAGLLTPARFTQSQTDGCRLDKNGRDAFFPAWYDEAEPFLRAPMRDSLALLLKTLRQFKFNYLQE